MDRCVLQGHGRIRHLSFRYYDEIAIHEIAARDRIAITNDDAARSIYYAMRHLPTHEKEPSHVTQADDAEQIISNPCKWVPTHLCPYPYRVSPVHLYCPLPGLSFGTLFDWLTARTRWTPHLHRLISSLNFSIYLPFPYKAGQCPQLSLLFLGHLPMPPRP
jgi:hypothetical protein